MPATTEINISNFLNVQSIKYDPSQKYLALPVSALREHEYGEEIANLMLKLKADFNQQNALSLKIEDSYPTAVYGFRIILNSEGIPVVSFGNLEDGANEVPIKFAKDEDGDLVINAGKAQIEFETPKGANGGNFTDAFVWFKKIRVKAYLQKASKDLTTADFKRAKNVEQLTALLGGMSGGGGYSYKLKELTDPKVIEAKGVTFPLVLDVLGLAKDEPFVGDGFISRDLKVKRADGKPLYGIDKNGQIGEVSIISVYNNSNAGSVCSDLGAARFVLCKHYGGTPQIIILKPNGTKSPTHTFPHYVSGDVHDAFKAAESELLNCHKEGKSYFHLLTPESKQKFLEASAPKQQASLPAEEVKLEKAANDSAVDQEDFKALDNFVPELTTTEEEEEPVFSFN